MRRILLSLLMMLCVYSGYSQVFSENFNRADNTTIGNGWTEIETTQSGAQVRTNRLQLGSTTTGREFVYRDGSSLYTTNGITNNTSLVEWAFNFRQTPLDPGGFGNGLYGIAFILGKTTNTSTDGNGYAVVIGGSGSTDAIRLTSFTGGPVADGNFTNIISGNDYGAEYLSVRVVYNAATDQWSLYAESNAATFPQSNPHLTSTQIGSTTVNTTFTATGSDLKYMGAFWNHGTNVGDNAIFDDVSIYVQTALKANLGDHLPGGATIGHTNDIITYEDTIKNTGTSDALGVILNNPTPAGTSFNAGSIKTSALARDDNYSTSFNTIFNTANVLTNDFGVPNPSVVSYGTTSSGGVTTLADGTGITDNGGSIMITAAGALTYTPLNNFTGTDKFKYIATTGNAGLPNNDAVVTITVGTDIAFGTTTVNILCNGSSTGSITFSNASGGAGGYTYSITGPNGTYQPSNIFNGLAANTYNLAVKDVNGFIKTSSVTLTQPPVISYSTSKVDPACNNASTGSITFNGTTGGNGPYTYSITGSSPGTFQASNSFLNLPAGSYTPVVKDLNGCTNTNAPISLVNPAAISFPAPTVVNNPCNGGNTGSITINASGGSGTLTYSKDNGTNYQASNVFSGLTAGTYSQLKVKDANGCTASNTATLTDPTAISAITGTIPQLTYNTAMATAIFSATGGTGSLEWSATGLPTGVVINSTTGNVTGTPTVTGSFNVVITATDDNNCTKTKSQTVLVAPKLVNDAYNVVGNTQLVADGHSTPTTPFTTSSTNILANDLPASPIAVTPVTNAATTAGGTITIDAAGKFTYTPPNGSTAADSYTYTATSNLVSATATINFTITNMIWYVNNTYGGANGAANGSSNRPYTTVNAAEAASATSQIIYVHTGSGNTTGDAFLKTGQTLRGAGSALNVGALSIAATTKPTLTGMITLAISVSVDGFDMSTGATTAITSNGATGVTVNVGNITTSGAVNAVTLSTTTGSVTIAGGNQTNSTGATFNISGGTVSLTYSGSASQATASQPLVNVSGGHNTGTITFQTGTLSATNGTGLQFDNADGTYNFNGTTTLNGGDAGIDITAGSDATAGSTGTFLFGTGTAITRANSVSGVAFNLAGSDANVTYNGSMTLGSSTGNMVFIDEHDAGTINFNIGNLTKGSSVTRGIVIQNSNGGTITFNNPAILITMTTGDAISLTGNTGGTINFAPVAGGNGIDLITTTGTGFNATGGGTINVTGTGNTITSVGGIALNVVSTTIGTSDLNFQSISANGGANGIILNSTGSSGGLTITGTGTANSGGIIQNMTGADDAGNIPVGTSIVLYRTSNVSLSRMKINDNSNYGINGISVAGLTISNCIVTGVNGTNQATPFSDGSITLLELSGTCSINNTEVAGGYQRNIRVDNTLGTLDLSVNACNIHNTSSAQGDDGLAIEIGSAGGASNATLHVTNNTFSAHGGDHFDLTVLESPIVSCVFTGNQGNPGSPVHAIGLGQGFRAAGGAFNGSFSYDYSNNTIYGTKQGNAITINKGSGTGTFQGRVSGNTIGQSGVTLSGASQSNGISVESRGGGTHTTLVTGNAIRQYREYGINIEGAEAGTTTFNVTCNSNTIDEPGSPGAAGLSLHGIQANWGIDVGNTSTLLLDLGGAVPLKNIVTNGGNEPAGGFDIRLRQRQSTTIKLLGYGGANNDNAAVQTYITGRNTLTTVLASNTVPTGGGYQNTASVPQPVVPL